MASSLPDRICFTLLLMVVLLAPIPLAGNRDWSWSLLALSSGALVLVWISYALLARRPLSAGVPGWITLLFLAAVSWAWLQTQSWVPDGWNHPVWSLVAPALGTPPAGTISLAPEDNLTALMRLLSYALVFWLALQLGRDRILARRALGWVFIAGSVYALYGLLSYWGVLRDLMWYHDDAYGRDVRATFVNRNHFANWLGIATVCAVAWFYDHMMRQPHYPMLALQTRQKRLDRFLRNAWLPLAGLILMVGALVSSHSRGGFVATFCGGLALLILIDRRQRTVSVRARAIVASALLVSATAFFITSEVLLDRLERSELDSPARLNIYSQTLRGIDDNPLLGYGYGTFEDGFKLYRGKEIRNLADRAHNSYLENVFELGLPAALCLFVAIAGLAAICLRGVFSRHIDWVFPAAGFAATVLAAVHAAVDFGMQIPATAMLYALVLGIATAQSFSSRSP